MSEVIDINQHMTREQLRNLKPRQARKVVLHVEGEKYPEREYKADEVEDFVGINGRIKFKS